MTSFWSAWVTILTVGSIVGVTWLLFANRHTESKGENELTSHAYDGVEEYDNPLPQWWFYLFVGTIVFGIAYLFLYPGLGNYKGYLGWTSTGQWEQRVAKADAKFAELATTFKRCTGCRSSHKITKLFAWVNVSTRATVLSVTARMHKAAMPSRI